MDERIIRKKFYIIIYVYNNSKSIIQGADFKLSRLSCRHIYPCNGLTGPSKVSLEPHESKEDFDMSQAKIGHSKLSQE